MSLYSKTAKIDGLEFGLVMRGTSNGQYVVVFEKESATLEQIEGVNWAEPTIEGNTILPKEYGFDVEGITYSSSDRSYHVTVRVGKQYLGDVTEYQEQIAELLADKQALAEQNTAQQEQITELEEQLAEADEALIAMYEQQTASAEPDTGEDTGGDTGESTGGDIAEDIGEGTGEEETE